MASLFNYKSELTRFNDIKNGEKAQTSKIFGIETIAFSIVAFAVIVVMRFLLTFFNDFMGNLGGNDITASLMDMFNLLIHVLFGFVSLSQFANAGLKCYFQFKLNDSVIKWIALGFVCAFFITGAVLFILTALTFIK